MFSSRVSLSILFFAAALCCMETDLSARTTDNSANEWQIAGNNADGNAGIWDKTKGVTSDVWDGTKEVTSDVWDGTKEVTSDVWDGTKKVGSDVKGAFTDDSKPVNNSSQPNNAK